jgi:hypothetical protein
VVSARKLEALQNLADRPGTPHEGAVARAMLEKLTGKPYTPTPQPAPRVHRPRAKKKAPAPVVPDYLKDPLKMAFEVRSRFPLGTKVWYSAKGFPVNSPGTVIGFERAGHRVMVDFEWFPIKTVVACTDRGWHLSKKPIPQKQAEKLYPKGKAGK